MKWPNRDDAWLNVVQQLRAALPKPQLAKPIAENSIEQTDPSRLERLRSSNLRIRKQFSDPDKDKEGFLDEAFEYMARFFEGSLQELEKRHNTLQTKFKKLMHEVLPPPFTKMASPSRDAASDMALPAVSTTVFAFRMATVCPPRALMKALALRLQTNPCFYGHLAWVGVAIKNN